MSQILCTLRELPQRLRRVTSSGSYKPEIDGLRFIAILFVIFWHFFERIGRAIGNSLGKTRLSDTITSHVSDGYAGSVIFFSISAFVLLTQFKKHNGSSRPKFLKDYFKRRLLRIEPPYILLLLGTYLLICVTGYTPKYTHAYAENTVPLTESLFASIFYLHNIIFNSMPRLFLPGWSLEIEVQFYILAPFLFSAYVSIPSQRARLAVNVGILIVSGILAYVVATHTNCGRFLFFTLVSQFEFFWTGIMAFELLSADWFNKIWHRKAITDCMAVLSLAAIAVVSTKAVTSSSFVFGLILFPFFFVILFAGATHGGLFKMFCSAPWVSLVGGACYSFYLTHMQIMILATEILSPHVPKMSVAFQIIAYTTVELPLLLVGGLCFYIFLERPFMVTNWPQKWSRYLLHKFSYKT